MYLECIPSTRAIYTAVIQDFWIGYVLMIRQTSLGVMVLNSPGAVSLPVTAPDGLFRLFLERESMEYL